MVTFNLYSHEIYYIVNVPLKAVIFIKPVMNNHFLVFVLIFHKIFRFCSDPKCQSKMSKYFNSAY